MIAKFLRSSIARASLAGLLTLVLVVGGSWFAEMKVIGADVASVTCEDVVPGKIYRYVAGIDECVVPLSEGEIENLTDPFGKTLLRQGIFPENTEGVTQEIAANLGYNPTSYVVGEGVQIPATVASREEARGIRYDISYGANENEGKIFMSKLAPSTTFSQIEILSFDNRTKEYNYYLLTPQQGASYDSPFVWAWTGNTSSAKQPGSMGNGCFSCHHNGIPIMREIELPWNNWQSQRATISAVNVSEAIAKDRYFLSRRGAEIFEQLIRGNIQSYYSNWLRQRTNRSGGIITISDVGEMLRHLTTNTTINFKSSDVQSKGANTSPKNLDIAGVPPNDTFLADTLLQTTLGLDYSTLSVNLPRADYDAYLKENDFKLVGTKGFFRTTEPAYEQRGSTYFAYYVPQVPAEDIYVTQKLLQSKIVTDKFVAALLMVDFQNPLFSEKRASLQKYAEQITTGTIANGVSSIPEDFAAKIKETGAQASNAEDFDASSAESQFLSTWELPDDQWKQVTANRLQAYVDSIANKEPSDRLDYLMRWSVEQRNRFASTRPFCAFYESRLLFPETSLSEIPDCPDLPTPGPNAGAVTVITQ